MKRLTYGEATITNEGSWIVEMENGVQVRAKLSHAITGYHWWYEVEPRDPKRDPFGFSSMRSVESLVEAKGGLPGETVAWGALHNDLVGDGCLTVHVRRNGRIEQLRYAGERIS